MLKSKEDEINKAILEWLIIKKYNEAVNGFKKDTNLAEKDATTGNKLEKKWCTILALQKKISDLENEVKQLKEDLERGGNGTLSEKQKKEASLMGLPKSVPKEVIKGHRLAVTSCCFHPFYKRLATGSEDASIIIWECDEFTQDKSLKAHSDTVNHLTFDNSGKYLASCSSDMSIKIWSFDTMTVYRSLTGHEHTVSSCEFSVDGNFLFSASRDKSIKYWDINSGNCIKTLTNHDDWVRSMSINIKGNLMASASDDEKIFVWEISSKENINIINELTGHKNKIDCLIFVKNEKAINNIFSSDYLLNDKNTKEDDSKNKENNEIEGKSNLQEKMDALLKYNEKLLQRHKNMSKKDKVNKDYLLSGSRDKAIILWDAITGNCLYTFVGHDNWVRGLCEHPNGKYFVSCSDDKTIRLWDLKSGLCQKKLINAHEKFIVSVSMSPVCKLLASGSNDFTVKVWDCS